MVMEFTDEEVDPRSKLEPEPPSTGLLWKDALLMIGVLPVLTNLISFGLLFLIGYMLKHGLDVEL